MQTNRKTEIQVGVTVLVALAVLLWGIAWLSAYAKARVQRVWVVRFEQAGGLGEGNDVLVNGVRKGVVKSLKLEGDHVLAEISLARDVTITHDSKVALRTVTMMGDKVIAVDYRATGGDWSVRDTVPGVFEKGLPEVMTDLGDVTGSVTRIATQLDSLATRLERDGGLTATVASFQRTSRELERAVAENRVALGQTMANLSSTSESARNLVAGREEQIKAALDHFSRAAENFDRLSTRLDSLRAVIESTAGKVDRGDGTLGRLVNDEKLYTDLNASVRDLRALLADLKANPRKYFKFSVF